ncbi:hypothetical protein [Thermus filiformis]|uniref:hypothetical protein n=1 Tax=Thermus filiformis TaxID=276 RepID=UPI0005312C04|nr:hypothetical protein [Thermus filiformis]
MKLHLKRLAKEKEVRFPGVEHLRVYEAREREERTGEFVYVVLEGEVVIDLPDGRYLHLRPFEAAHLTGPHLLLPVERALLLEIRA